MENLKSKWPESHVNYLKKSKEFREVYQDGDEVWNWESGDQRGFCIIRNDEIVYKVRVIQNAI